MTAAAGRPALRTLPPRVLVLSGATASGKSDLAARLAEALGGEVVGADSRQVYRFLDIGTAKPTAAQRSLAPHHLVDVVDPDSDYDVAAWRRDALDVLADIHARGRVAVVCGGTGLYLRSLEHGLFAGPPADAALRARLAAEEEAAPGCLHARLAAVDAATARRLHPNDRVRVVRALEVFEVTGRPLSAWLAEHGLSERPFETRTLEVRAAGADLAARIEARSLAMVEAGLVEEAEALVRRWPREARAFDAIGYREALACLDGALARTDLARTIAIATAQYAKRQRTWLRGQARTEPVAPGDLDTALRLARAFYS